MINEVCEFPDNIPVNKPIPGKAGFKDGKPVEETYAECHGGNRKKPGDEAVKDEYKKWHFVLFYPELFVQ